MKGIGVSPGISIGRAFVIQKNEAAPTNVLLTDRTEITAEIEKLSRAIGAAIAEIELLQSTSTSDKDIALLETQTELLSDPEILEAALARCPSHRLQSFCAVGSVGVAVQDAV